MLGLQKKKTECMRYMRSVGHRVKTHRITPATGNEGGDVEIKDYVILIRGEDDRIPPRTLVMDVTQNKDTVLSSDIRG